MKRTLTLAICVAGLFPLSACIDVNQEFTLNPDGSGKVVHRVVEADPFGEGESSLVSTVVSRLQEAEGVDVWSDLSASITEDGSIRFEGTAYFHDLNGLKLGLSDELSFRWSADRTGGGVVSVPRDGGVQKAPAKSAPMSEAVIAAGVAKRRAGWKKSRAKTAAAIEPMRWQSIFRLPSEIRAISGFDRVDQRTVKFVLEGEAVISKLDDLASDDAFMKRATMEGTNPFELDLLKLPSRAMSLIFGDQAEISAKTAAAAAPLFDYAAEVNAAKAGYKAMIASLPGIGETVALKLAPVPPANGGPFKSLRVKSVAYTLQDGTPPGFRATVTIACVLPGAVADVFNGTLKTAVTIDGLELLPEGVDRNLETWVGSDDRTTIMFRTNLTLPDRRIGGFREISGLISYKSLAGTSRVDLGFAELTEGAGGTRFEAKISSIKPVPEEGGEGISLEIALPRGDVARVEFTDAKGGAIKARLAGGTGARESTNVYYVVKGQIPRDGHVIVIVREGKNYEIPFKIENVDLLGHAIK